MGQGRQVPIFDKKKKMTAAVDTSRVQLKPVKVTFLEMHQPPDEAMAIKEGIECRPLTRPISVDNYRHYYYGVGEKYFWLDRMLMDDEKLAVLINAQHIDIFVMYIHGEAAGYAEFRKEEDFTEIVYFGLLPAFVGKGWGKYFLNWVISQAWSYKPGWIRLDTCELDHPHALGNYKRRGFIEVRNEVQERKVLF